MYAAFTTMWLTPRAAKAPVMVCMTRDFPVPPLPQSIIWMGGGEVPCNAPARYQSTIWYAQSWSGFNNPGQQPVVGLAQIRLPQGLLWVEMIAVCRVHMSYPNKPYFPYISITKRLYTISIFIPQTAPWTRVQRSTV